MDDKITDNKTAIPQIITDVDRSDINSNVTQKLSNIKLLIPTENSKKDDKKSTTVAATNPPPKVVSGDKANPSASDTDKKNPTVEKLPTINMSELKKSNFLFIKSYYAHDFLNPYIRCFIQNESYNKDWTELQKRNFQQNFFDIPYNLIKSMEFEHVGGGGVEGVLKMKIEDASGAIGTFLIGALFSMSLTANSKPVPNINIQFGWSPNGLKKISKSDMKKIFTKNSYESFVVMKADLEFDEKGRQDIVITARQDGTGAASSFESGDNSPFQTIGAEPIHNIRLIQYYHYLKSFNSNNLELGLAKFSVYKQSDKKKIEEIEEQVKKFLKNIVFSSNSIREIKDNSLIGSLIKDNHLFNPEKSINGTNFVEMRDTFSQHLTKTHFNNYLIFCYILNQYIMTLKQIFSTQGENLDFIVLPLYDEKQINDTGLVFDLSKLKDKDFSKISIEDVNLGKSKPKSVGNILTEFKIEKTDTWETLLTRIGKLVKIGPAKNASNLFISVKRYTQDTTNSTIKPSDIYKTSSKEELIKKFESLRDAIKSDDAKKKAIDLFIKQIEEQTKDFIYIVITPGSPFLTDQTFVDKIIAQSYTVYPKINVTDRLKDQNFNSGSKSLADGSFPDVIYFKPKLNYFNAINSNIAARSDINYNNGVFTFSLKNIEIKTISNGEIDSRNISSLIKELTEFINPKKGESALRIVPTRVNSNDSFYTLNSQPSIMIKHESLNDVEEFNNYNEEDKKKVQSLINDLKEYENTLRRGYHYSTLLGIIKKTNNISIGDNNTLSYYNYVTAANEYNKILAHASKGFEAELKIVGEPAFSVHHTSTINIVLIVNNLDGSINYLFSGLYFVKKVKQEITEKGSFNTILTLTYDSPYVND
jgi:hypothetical protein